MELIIKPTGLCNFNCTFCSADTLNIQHPKCLQKQIKDVINTLKPESVMITGGDPLMVPIDYYYELLSLGDFSLSLTTNLKNFYLNTEYWKPLFLKERVGVTTSFQYGSGRLWDANTPYTENMFKDVMYKFNKEIGYMPPFVVVIDENNCDKALDHIYLAKELGTKCKLNPLLAMGKSKTFFPKYKIVDIWLKVKELGLEEYFDCSIMFYRGGCALNTNLLCSSSLRAVYVDGNDKLHYSNCEEWLSIGKEIPIDENRPKLEAEHIDINDLINYNCMQCELYRFCNGCKIGRMLAKQTPNHCEEMLKRKDSIMKSGWVI